jgi:hypothetical protein
MAGGEARPRVVAPCLEGAGPHTTRAGMRLAGPTTAGARIAAHITGTKLVALWDDDLLAAVAKAKAESGLGKMPSRQRRQTLIPRHQGALKIR